MWRFGAVWVFAILLSISIACSRKPVSENVIVEIPAGFSGNFVLDTGVRGSAPLEQQGDAYVVSVPTNGKAQTSTLLHNPHVTFKNSSSGQVWGFSQKVFTTGDGIAIGGRIEFFVGTQKEFDAEQQKKNKSDGIFNIEASVVSA
jgi:hypothetical protein